MDTHRLPHLLLSVAVTLVVSVLPDPAAATVVGRDLDGNAANGFEAYYDSQQNVTWLADANAFATRLNGLASFTERSSYINSILAAAPIIDGHAVTLHDLGVDTQYMSPTGAMTWWGAMAFAAVASFHGRSDWRLPTLVDALNPGCDAGFQGTDCGWSVDTTDAELAHMYYDILDRPPGRGPAGEQWPAYGIPNQTAMPIPGVSNGIVFNLKSDSYWYDLSDAANPDRAWSFFNTGGEQSTELKNGLHSISRAWLVRDGDIAVTATVMAPGTLALAAVGLLAGLAAKRRRANA